MLTRFFLVSASARTAKEAEGAARFGLLLWLRVEANLLITIRHRYSGVFGVSHDVVFRVYFSFNEKGCELS